MHSVGDALNNELALYGGDSNLLQAGNVSWYSDTSVPALYMDSKGHLVDSSHLFFSVLCT